MCVHNQQTHFLQNAGWSRPWSWSCYNYAPYAQHRVLIESWCFWADVQSVPFVFGIFSFCLYFTLTRWNIMRQTVWFRLEESMQNLGEIKKQNKHCQKRIFVSIHEGLLMNGIFNQLHPFKEWPRCLLVICTVQTILCRNPGHHKTRMFLRNSFTTPGEHEHFTVLFTV